MSEKQRVDKGTRAMVWLPKELGPKVEKARVVLGLGKSQFYRFCIIETLKGMTQKIEAVPNGFSED